ncbi:hypothetical protein RQP46_007701 [Phenoliferia psychrophenolica]
MSVSWELRHRACTSCFRSNSVQAAKLKQHHPNTLQCVPCYPWKDLTFVWAPHVYHVSAKLYLLEWKQRKESSTVFDDYITAMSTNAHLAVRDAPAFKAWEAAEAGRRARFDEAEKKNRKIKFRNTHWIHSKYVERPKDLTPRSTFAATEPDQTRVLCADRSTIQTGKPFDPIA